MKSVFMKALLIFAAVIVILTASAYALVILSPQIAFYSSVSTAFSDFLSRDEFSPVAQSLKHSSLELDSSVREYQSDSATVVRGKIYPMKRGVFASGIEYDNGLLKVNGNLYFDSDYMYLESEDMLGGAYGLVSGTSEETFENSIFADPDSEYAIGEPQKEKITKYLQKYDDGTLDEISKETKKILVKYANKVYGLVCEYGDFSDEREDVRRITLTLDKDALINICDELYASFVTDREFRDLFIKYAQMIDGLSDPVTVYQGFIESFADLIEHLKDPDYDLSYTVKISTARFFAKLQNISVTVLENGETKELFALDAGDGGFKKSDKISFTTGNNTFTYEIKKDTSNEFELEIYKDYKNLGTGYEYKKSLFLVEIDREDGKLDILLNDKCTVLSGSIEKSFLKTEIAIDGITRINSYTKEEYKFDTAKINVVLKKLDFVFLSVDALGKNEIKPLSELKASDIKLGYGK